MRINGIEIDINSITIKDMPNEQFEDIFSSCGAEVAVKLLADFGGSKIQVPTRGFKKIEERMIKDEYDGTAIGIQRLARKFGTTEKNIRDILYSKKYSVPAEGQTQLFNPEDYRKKEQ